MKYPGVQLIDDDGQSHLDRGTWVEIVTLLTLRLIRVSHHFRGAGIEIVLGPWGFHPIFVAPRKGCVG